MTACHTSVFVTPAKMMQVTSRSNKNHFSTWKAYISLVYSVCNNSFKLRSNMYSILVQGCKNLPLIEDCLKTYRTTYEETVTVDLLGWITFRSKISKTSVRQILSSFWFHILLVCKISVLQIFILLCMNAESDPIFLFLNFEVGSYG